MTLKEMKDRLEEQQLRITVAEDMTSALNRFLSGYFSYQYDEDGNIKYDEDYNPLFDLNSPTLGEERSVQALALHEYLQLAMTKWITK